ncbi:MAG TPA: outer membrane protein assembly factor BamD [Campylobacterales bacterium]|nr:outer membrane protein assembly factor BamD [Campylobacterales bacterium]
MMLLTACSDKDAVHEYDKPALSWYQEIVKEIDSSNLDKADNLYISLRSEHARSPLLPEATMMLANAHMDDQAYIMADYYLDEYLKKYASGSKVEQAKFLKIKAAFLGIKDVNKEQQLMLNTLTEVDKFVKSYPNSIYLPIVSTIKVRLHMSEYLLNENIANLYDRLGKEKAKEIYENKNAHSPLNMADIKAPEIGFIDAILK